MRTAFFHEDDYCQWEILPLTAKAYCLKEMGEIDEFAEAHQAGTGFTDLYIRDDSPHSIEELSLHSKQLDEALSFLPAYDRVETGYSSYREELKSTHGRGEGAQQNVFWSVDETGRVNALWLELWITPEAKDLWRRILITLGQVAPVLLADWGWSQCVDLTSPREIEQYVADKVSSAIQFLKDMKKDQETGK